MNSERDSVGPMLSEYLDGNDQKDNCPLKKPLSERVSQHKDSSCWESWEVINLWWVVGQRFSVYTVQSMFVIFCQTTGNVV